MLISCPECQNQVSSKALNCPKCGYPFQKRSRSSSKKARLPNGFGSITKLNKKNLRNPYFVRVTVGKTNEGRCITKPLKPISYFKTYNDAYAALIEYHRNPCEIRTDLTIKELYLEWTSSYFKKLSKSSITNITNAWTYCETIYDLKLQDLRTRHIKYCLDNAKKYNTRGPNKGTYRLADDKQRKRIKSMFNNMLDYAIEYEYIDRNYSRAFTVEVDESKRSYYHIPFTLDELEKLRENGSKYALMIVIQSYMGLRPGELCDIETANINIERGYVQCGSKTKYGIDRIVPIHSKIKNIFLDFYNQSLRDNNEYLFNDNGHRIDYPKYLQGFRNIIKELNMNPNHKPHDARMGFITHAKASNINEFALKRIVGHSFKNDITESVYTKRTYNWLCEEMEKVEYTNSIQTEQIL